MSAAMHLDLRRLLTGTPDDSRPTPWRAGRRVQHFAWLTIAGRAAVVVVAVTGWIAAVAFAARYRAQCADYAAAQRTIADLESSRQALDSFHQNAAQRVALAKPAAAGSPAAVGNFVQTRGTVLVLPEGEGKALPVSVGIPVPTGRSLWTCPWGAAAMRFADGVLVDLERNTVAAISETGSVRQVTLKKGVAFVTQLGPAHEHKMVVTTADGSVTVADAQVAVAVSPRGTIIEVAQGKVHFTRKAEDRGVMVAAGQYVIVGPGNEPRALDGRLAWSLEPIK
jgi:ferric-dicitrate binding protein FerR (iron transport regulator)